MDGNVLSTDGLSCFLVVRLAERDEKRREQRGKDGKRSIGYTIARKREFDGGKKKGTMIEETMRVKRRRE